MVNFLLPIFEVSSKNGKLFVADFSDFYLAVSASANDAKHRKPNSFIIPMTRDMGKKMLPAVKTGFFGRRFKFSYFYLPVSASINDANHLKPKSFFKPMTRDMGQNMLQQ